MTAAATNGVQPGPQVTKEVTLTVSSVNHAPRSKIPPLEVGWQFVSEYYMYLSKDSHRLHCFYDKDSVMLHGVEGESVKQCQGQQVSVAFVLLFFSRCGQYSDVGGARKFTSALLTWSFKRARWPFPMWIARPP
jgi:hypothetical protein